MTEKIKKDQQLSELIKLRKMVQEIKTDIDEETNKPFWKRGLQAFGIGVLRGIGFVIGTTILAAIFIYVLQIIMSWLQIDVLNWIGQI